MARVGLHPIRYKPTEGVLRVEQIFVIKLETEERMDPLMMANDLSEYMSYDITEVIEVVTEEDEEAQTCDKCVYDSDCIMQEYGALGCGVLHRPKEVNDDLE